MGEVTTLPTPEPKTPMVSGGRPMAIVPQSMEEAYRLAKAICMAGMAPRGLDTPEKAMVAIMHGLEVGLTPMAALQRIAVVNGRPTIWGDGAIGLVRGSGLCEFVREVVEGAGDARTATCTAKRKGDPEAIVRTFSVADAKKAGLWGKGGPWQQFPDRMLSMRARAFALRDGFADVLGGMYLREEIEDQPREVTPPSAPAAKLAPPTPPSPPQPGEIVKRIAAESWQRPDMSEEPAAEEPLDMAAFVRDGCDAIEACQSLDALDEVWACQVEVALDDVFPPDRELLRKAYDKARERLS